MTMTVFGNLILLSIEFYDCFPVFAFLILVLNEKIYQTLKTMFDHIFKQLEVHQKCSAACRIFNSLLCEWSNMVFCV